MLQRTQTGAGKSRACLAALLGWVIPGGGHVSSGRRLRGFVIGGVVLLMFGSGLLLGGHLFGLHSVAEVGLLGYIYGFCNLGVGLIYFLCLWANVGMLDQAQRPTAEYGNIFLMISGLLNFLAILDSYDIKVGRKP